MHQYLSLIQTLEVNWQCTYSKNFHLIILFFSILCATHFIHNLEEECITSFFLQENYIFFSFHGLLTYVSFFFKLSTTTDKNN